MVQLPPGLAWGYASTFVIHLTALSKHVLQGHKNPSEKVLLLHATDDTA